MKYLMQKFIYLTSIHLLCVFPLYVHAQSSFSVTVDIDESIPVSERESKYDRPLAKALQETRLGRVVGGESKTMKSGTKVWSKTKVYVELYDSEKGIPFLKRKLHDIGVPSGTLISYNDKREESGNTITISGTSEFVDPPQSPPPRIEPMSDEKTRQIAADNPDQFKTLCECTEKDGWLALSRNSSKWHLSDLKMWVDEGSGFFVPITTPDETSYYFRIKELKAGDVQIPSIANVKDVSQEGLEALRFGLDSEFGNPIERKSNYFGEGENIEMTFHGERYKFSYTKDDYTIYLSTSKGLIRFGDGTAGEQMTVVWVGDLNRDDKLDFILAGIKNIPGVKDDRTWNLFMSSANGCYRVIPHLSYENYLVGSDGGVVPPPNPASKFCVKQ